MTVEPIYTKQSPMSSPGQYADALCALPRDVPSLTRAIQGLQIHEFMLGAYGVNAPQTRKRESQLRSLEAMLAAVRARDPRPLEVAREPAERLIGVCRHFALWLVAALRQQGVPARARWGFATYFNPGWYEDHIVAEYWNPAQASWTLVDAQLDGLQREHLGVDFDPLDVPHDRFISAAAAWQKCRTGELDPQRFGISPANLHGLWFITGSLVREVAALRALELLPWDVWGAMAKPSAPLSHDELAFFDRIAQLTAAADEHAGELRALFESDARLNPAGEVWNDRMQRLERVD